MEGVVTHSRLSSNHHHHKSCNDGSRALGKGEDLIPTGGYGRRNTLRGRFVQFEASSDVVSHGACFEKLHLEFWTQLRHSIVSTVTIISK